MLIRFSAFHSDPNIWDYLYILFLFVSSLANPKYWVTRHGKVHIALKKMP